MCRAWAVYIQYVCLMALAFLEQHTVHADHPALAASCRRHGWESLPDLLRAQELVGTAEGLAAVGVTTSFAVQKLLRELRTLAGSANARPIARSVSHEDNAARILQAACRTARASKDFGRLRALLVSNDALSPPPARSMRGTNDAVADPPIRGGTWTHSEELAALEAELQADAAVTVQAHWRDHQDRKRALEMTERGKASLGPRHTAQQELEDLAAGVAELEAELREDAAVTVQAHGLTGPVPPWSD
eukprot:COSAG02_NODE_6713_length_3405_cov_2.429220_1_plen_247_part_00